MSDILSGINGNMLGETVGKLLANPELMKIISSMATPTSASQAENTDTGSEGAEEREGADKPIGTSTETPVTETAVKTEGANEPPTASVASVLGRIPELSGVLQPLLPLLAKRNIGGEGAGNISAAERKRQADRRCALLYALKPYLTSESRRSAVDVVISVSKIGSLLG